MTSQCAIIRGRNVSIGYSQSGQKPRVVHPGLDFDLYSGALTSLLGSNGTGKSTLLKTLSGLLKLLGGSVEIQGRPLHSFDEEAFSQVISIVLTAKTYAGGLSVYELVSLGRYPYTGFFGKLTEQDHRIIRQVLEKTGIAHLAHVLTGELSDGERQKAMIAKALAQESPIILLDEPTAYLDITSRMEIMKLLHTLAKDEHKAILLSTHDLETALRLSDKLWLMMEGESLISGIPEDLALDGNLEKFYRSSGMHFDRFTGQFSLPGDNKIPIALEVPKLYRHWLANALMRNGYSPVKTSETSSILTVTANESREYILTREGKVLESFSSLEHLLRYLNSEDALTTT